MSFFSDFLLAQKRDAKKVAATDNPTETWPGVACKNLTSLDVAALYGAFLGKTGDDEVVDLMDDFEELPCRNESVELLMFPAEFISLLAALEPKKMRALVKLWRESEVEVSHWSAQETQELLGQLCDLARQAIEKKKPIMLCVSGF